MQKSQNSFFLKNEFRNGKNQEEKITQKSNFTLCDKLNLRSELIWHLYHKSKIFHAEKQMSIWAADADADADDH